MRVVGFHLMPWTEVEHAVAWPFSEDEYDPELGHELYEQYLGQLELCEEVGFDVVGVNEHHYSSYGLMPSPNLMASRLIECTDDIRIAVMGNILPLRGHPVRIAEEVAMLDVMSDGRLVSGFVRGIPSEYAAYGVDPDQSRARFSEATELITRAWTDPEPFDFDGELYQYDDVYIWPRPIQDPHPPLWMPAESEKSIRFAAERRIPIGRVFAGTQNCADTFNRYREIAETEYDWTPTSDYFWPCRFVYVSESNEQARAETEEHVEYFYEKLLGALYKSGAVKAVGDSEYREENAFEYEAKAKDVNSLAEKAMDPDFDELQQTGEIIVGDAEYVTDEIERQYETMGGFGTLINLFHVGTLPDELTRQSLRRFGNEVLPEIRDLCDDIDLSEFARRQAEAQQAPTEPSG